MVLAKYIYEHMKTKLFPLILASRTSLLSYTSVLIIEVKRNSRLLAYSFISIFFFLFTIKQVGNLNNLTVSPEQAHIVLPTGNPNPATNKVLLAAAGSCECPGLDPKPWSQSGWMWWGRPSRAQGNSSLAYGSVLCFLSSAMARFLQPLTRMLRAPVL